MKKVLFALAILFAFQVNMTFAAPINDLKVGESAGGIMTHGGHQNTFYLETQLTDTLTVGFQTDDSSDSGNMTDFYGQFHSGENDNLRVILGNRTYDSKSNCYLGMALTNQMSDEWYGYTSLIGGSGFQEFQLGANYDLTDTASINFNYRASSYKDSKNGVGIGLTCKF